MSKRKDKKLLSESTIRKFMKLANIEPLTDSFLTETGAGLADKGGVGQGTFSKQKDHRNTKMSVSTKHGTKTGTPVTKGPGLVKEEEEELDDELVDDMGDMPVDDEPVDDMDDMGDEGMAEGDIEGLVAAIADAIESHTGVSVDVAGDEEAAPEMDAPAPEGEEGGEEDLPPEPDMGGEEEEVLEGFDMIDEDEVVNETFRRVKSRLRKMQKEEQLLESLTNKIHARLSRKKSRSRRK